jgi:hypothetical protein
MSSPLSLEDTITIRQAYLTMFEYLEREWELLGRPGELGALLGSLSLWETESGQKEPMDAAVFPEWLDCAEKVLESESGNRKYTGADILLDGKPPTIKVKR